VNKRKLCANCAHFVSSTCLHCDRKSLWERKPRVTSGGERNCGNCISGTEEVVIRRKGDPEVIRMIRCRCTGVVKGLKDPDSDCPMWAKKEEKEMPLNEGVMGKVGGKAYRDNLSREVRLDLISPQAIIRLGRILKEGEVHPAHWTTKDPGHHLNCAIGHLMAHMEGDDTQDHLAKALCRIMFEMDVEAKSKNDDEAVMGDRETTVGTIKVKIEVDSDQYEESMTRMAEMARTLREDVEFIQDTIEDLSTPDDSYKIYVCAPLGGTVRLNVQRVKTAVKVLIEEYSLRQANEELIQMPTFIVPHFALNGIGFDGDKETNRDLGMQMCMDLIKVCDEVIVLGDRTTPGMRAEISLAAELGMKVTWREEL
jgi:hypothetical protein